MILKVHINVRHRPINYSPSIIRDSDGSSIEETELLKYGRVHDRNQMSVVIAIYRDDAMLDIIFFMVARLI